MILEINNLKEIIVRVNEGSGIVLKLESDSKCYVLTAYHNIESSVENKEEISLFDYKNKPYSIMGEAYCDIENDFALLEIEYIDTNIPIVKYDKNILPDDTITFIGYPDKAELERKRLNGAVIEWNDKTAINVLEEIKGSFVVKEYTDEVIVGFSGSGVFKKYGQEISLIGILKSLPEKDFDYKEISCVPIKKILSFIQDKLGSLFAFEKIHELMYEKQQHTERVLFNIHTKIKFNIQSIELDRSKEIKKLKDEILLENQFLILTGVGGVGKTAIIKKLYEDKKEKIPFYLFEANEFDLSLIDDLFGNYNFQNFIDIHKQYKQKIIVIDSAEKLLDIDNFKPFKEFLSTLIQSKWKVIFTIRDSSLKDLKSRFFDDSEVKIPIILLKKFTINELSIFANKYNFTLSKDMKLNELITNPFYLNKYLKFYDIEEGLIYQEFKQKLWEKTIKSKDEKCFLDLAYKRVKKGLFHIYIDCKSNSLESLVEDKVLGFEREGYFITHDIYEEWALEKVIDRRFDNRKNNKRFFEKIVNKLPIRRSLRNWVSEQLLLKNDDIKLFIEEIIDDNEIEQFWKDEVFISILLSDYSDTFFEKFERELLVNDYALLKRMSFLLRLACTEADETDFESYSVDNFFIFNKPKGNGWKSFINFVYKHIENMRFYNINEILPILYDWNFQYRSGKTTLQSSLIVLKYYGWINKDKDNYSEYIEKICKVIINGVHEIEDILEIIFEAILVNKWKSSQDYYYDLSKMILSTHDRVPKAVPIIYKMPEYVLKLADLFWSNEKPIIGVDVYYNCEYFPSEAYKTPIYYMLKLDFINTVNFVLKFIDKAIEENIYLDENINIQKIYLKIDEKIEIEQYHNEELWNIYIGRGSYPLLQSLHMALEKYLLEIAKYLDPKSLETCLKYLLSQSKSSSISAIVTSIVLTYPHKTFNIALILFQTKEFIDADFIRNHYEMQNKLRDENYFNDLEANVSAGLNNRNKIYTKKPLKRYKEIELRILFLQYQYYPFVDKTKLWSILDNYYLILTSEEKDFFYEIDVRRQKFSSSLLSLDIEDKTRDNKQLEKLYLWLNNNQDYKQKKDILTTVLNELQEIIKKSNNIILKDEIILNTCIFLLKDFNNILSKEDKENCKNIIWEIALLSLRQENSHQILEDSIYFAVSNIPILLNDFQNLKQDTKMILLLNLFKDYEESKLKFQDNAIDAILNYYTVEEIENFILGYFFLKPKYDSLYNKYYSNNIKLREIFIEKFELDIQKFINNKLSLQDINFDIEINLFPFIKILSKFIKLSIKPSDICKEISKIIFQSIEKSKNIDVEIKQRLFNLLPYLVYKLEINNIKEYLQPLLDNFKIEKNIVELLLEFILIQNEVNEYNKFWFVWELFEDKLIKICGKSKCNCTKEIVETYLFSKSTYGLIWKHEDKEWHTLKEKDKRFFKRMSEQMGHCPSTLYSISTLLTGIGSSYLNDGISWISYMVKNNKNLLTDELESDTIFNLEIIARKYILKNRQKIKKQKAKKEEILAILNFLIEKGSDNGYMLIERIL